MSEDDNLPPGRQPLVEEPDANTPLSNMIAHVDPIPMGFTIDADGLAQEIDPPWRPKDADPVPLTPETFTCMRNDALNLPPCKWYKRQRVLDMTVCEEPFIVRMCTCPELKTYGGASINTNDAGLYDCEMRDPPNPASARILDKIDANIVKKGTFRLEFERREGRKPGYPLFRTLEWYDQGKNEADEGEFLDPAEQEKRLDEYLKLREQGLVGPAAKEATAAEVAALEEDS